MVTKQCQMCGISVTRKSERLFTKYKGIFCGNECRCKKSRKFSDEQVIESYNRFKNVHLVAKELNVTADSVHQRLILLGISRNVNHFSDEEINKIKSCYESYRDNNELQKLANELGRSVTVICSYAKKLGLTDKSHPKTKIGIWKYMDLEAIREVFEKLKQSGLSIADFCKINNYGNRSISRYFKEKLGEEWDNHCKLSEERTKIMTERMQNTKRKNGTLHIPAKYKTYSRAKIGRRIDLDNKFFRSAWEANYARYLNLLIDKKEIVSWEFESERFYFKTLPTLSYCPDFKVRKCDGLYEYHEIKGWMDKRSKTLLEGMAIEYPLVKLLVIGKDEYFKIEKDYSNVLTEWESARDNNSLQKASVIVDDALIVSVDGSRIMGVDKGNPRVEIAIGAV